MFRSEGFYVDPIDLLGSGFDLTPPQTPADGLTTSLSKDGGPGLA